MSSSQLPEAAQSSSDDEVEELLQEITNSTQFPSGVQLYKTFRAEKNGEYGNLDDFANDTLKLFFDNTAKILASDIRTKALSSPSTANIEDILSTSDKENFHTVPIRMFEVLAQCLQYKPLSHLLAKQLLNAVLAPSRNKQMSIKDFVISHLKKEKNAKKLQGRTESPLRA